MTGLAAARGDLVRVGLGLRREHWEALLEGPAAARAAARIDFLEVLVEHFAGFGGEPREVVAELARRYSIVLHGVGLSLGSTDPLDLRYLDRVAALAELTGAQWWSDHLAWSSVGGVHTHDLLPLPLTDEALAHVAERARLAAAHVGRPLLLENATYYVSWNPPGDPPPLDEATFIRAVLAAVGASEVGLLLDVNNAWVNARNHGGDARVFIDALPLDRVGQVHLAGPSELEGGLLVDSHATPVRAEVLALYAHLVARARAAGRALPTVLEWDHDVPPLDVVLGEVDRIRGAASAHAGGGDAAG